MTQTQAEQTSGMMDRQCKAEHFVVRQCPDGVVDNRPIIPSILAILGSEDDYTPCTTGYSVPD